MPVVTSGTPVVKVQVHYLALLTLPTPSVSSRRDVFIHPSRYVSQIVYGRRAYGGTGRGGSSTVPTGSTRSDPGSPTDPDPVTTSPKGVTGLPRHCVCSSPLINVFPKTFGTHCSSRHNPGHCSRKKGKQKANKISLILFLDSSCS